MKGGSSVAILALFKGATTATVVGVVCGSHGVGCSASTKAASYANEPFKGEKALAGVEFLVEEALLVDFEGAVSDAALG